MLQNREGSKLSAWFSVHIGVGEFFFDTKMFPYDSYPLEKSFDTPAKKMATQSGFNQVKWFQWLVRDAGYIPR